MKRYAMSWRLWVMLALVASMDVFRIVLHATDAAHIAWYRYLPFVTLMTLPLVLDFARSRAKRRDWLKELENTRKKLASAEEAMRGMDIVLIRTEDELRKLKYPTA